MGQHLPYTNTRLLLASDSEEEYYTAGTVVRLFSSQPAGPSHPAVRQTLQGLHPRCVQCREWAAGDCRGPALPANSLPVRSGAAAGSATALPSPGTGLTEVVVLPCRRISLGALAVQALVNKRGTMRLAASRLSTAAAATPPLPPRCFRLPTTNRLPVVARHVAGPDGVVGVIPGEDKHSTRCAPRATCVCPGALALHSACCRPAFIPPIPPAPPYTHTHKIAHV